MILNRFFSRPGLTSVVTVLTLSGASHALAADLTLKISNIETDKGNMMVAVYDAEEAFGKKSTYRAISRRAEKGQMSIVLSDVPAGEYAVMVFQDLDENQKLDTNLLGIPKEPWSGSLQGRSVFGPPGWSDVNFKFGEQDATIQIEMK